jgi:hypothetical protein
VPPGCPQGEFLESCAFRYGETTDFDCHRVERTSLRAGLAPRGSPAPIHEALSRQQRSRGFSKREYGFLGMPSTVLLHDQTSEAAGGYYNPRAPKLCYSAQELSSWPSIHSGLICTP